MPPLAIPVEDSYLAVVPALKASFPAFAASPDYALVDSCGDLPGVILAAFARYLIELAGNATAAAEVSRGIAVINALYDSDDYRIREAIRDEFIEAFDGAPGAATLVAPMLAAPLAQAIARLQQ